jgi:hypothetical protein
MEQDEDGIPNQVTKAFRNKEDAIRFVEHRSKDMEYPQGNTVSLTVLEDNSDGTAYFVGAADPDFSWWNWTIVETTLE